MKRPAASFCVIVMAFLFGCSKGPACNDADVRKLVLDISREKVKIELAKRVLVASIYMPQLYGIKKEVSGEENLKQISHIADELMKQSEINLSGVRTKSRYDTLRRCDCEANLDFKADVYEGSLQIKYTASYAEGGKIKVELK